MMLRALDLYCGAGGAARGLQNAGFHVTGVDIFDQPRYCGDRFMQIDALSLDVWSLLDFDFIWASPPCQAHTALKGMHNAKQHRSLIYSTRVRLIASGRPYVIENVVGAPLDNPFMLCGTMFGLGCGNYAELRRHRIFETNFSVDVPRCRHTDLAVIGVYGGHVRNRKRSAGKNREAKDFTAQDGKTAMGIDWMTGAELSQSVPPAYSTFIAQQWLEGRQSASFQAIAPRPVGPSRAQWEDGSVLWDGEAVTREDVERVTKAFGPRPYRDFLTGKMPQDDGAA